MRKSDIMFISLLRQDARQTLTVMSKKTKIPISTLFQKLKQQEKSVITKHTTIIDFEKLGYDCRANIMISCPRDKQDGLRRHLINHKNINSLFRINNGFDFLAEGVFSNVRELENFMDDICLKFSITDKKIFYIIEDLKREGFLSDPERAFEFNSNEEQKESKMIKDDYM